MFSVGATVAALGVLLAVAGPPAAASEDPPHIVMLLADDLGYNDLSWVNDAAHTPHLDALREGGVELTRHITASSCSPSRSALLSGREPIHVNELTQASTVEGAGSECICGHGTRSMQRFVSSDTGVHDGMMRALVVPADMTTIAEKLKTAGYATAQIGKWHVGSSSPRKIPSGRGFDESYGSIGGHTDHYTSMRDVVGCGEFPDLWRTDGPAPLVTGGDYVGTHYVNEAVRIINDHDAAAAPLFLYVALQQPHTPLDVPDSYLTPFEDGVGNDPSWNLRKKYLGLVNFLDEALGLIEDALTANSMYSDTLIVFASDNGGSGSAATNYPLRGAKFADWQGGVQVRALVGGGYLPDSVRGTQRDDLTHISDWYPTFCALAGVDAEDAVASAAGLPGVDGFDLWPMLTNGAVDGPRTEATLSSSNSNGNGGFDGVNFIQWPYKLLLGDMRYSTYTVDGNPLQSTPVVSSTDVHSCGTGCLFNLEDDPDESDDLAASKPEVLASMRQRSLELLDGAYDPPRGQLRNQAACDAVAIRGGRWTPWLDCDASPDEVAYVFHAAEQGMRCLHADSANNLFTNFDGAVDPVMTQDECIAECMTSDPVCSCMTWVASTGRCDTWNDQATLSGGAASARPFFVNRGELPARECAGNEPSPAADDKLAQCKAFATKFRNTCAEAPDAAASAVATMQGDEVSCFGVGQCPDIGTVEGDKCTWERKTCVSCRDDAGTVRIRVQSNSLPDVCYTTPTQVPNSLDVDFEVVWDAAYETTEITPETAQEVTDLMCDIQHSSDNGMPGTVEYTKYGSTGLNTLVGVALNGVSILNAISAEGVDPFVPPAAADDDAATAYEIEKVDKCLAHPQAAGVYHYHLISPCLFDASVDGATNCNAANDCDDVIAHALDGFTADDGAQPLGISKDGHAMYGPYNDDGEEWSGFNVCNGLDRDGSYVYVSTTTWPYHVGCFGRGNYPQAAPTCTANAAIYTAPCSPECAYDEFEVSACSETMDRVCAACDARCAFGCTGSTADDCLDNPCQATEYFGNGSCAACTSNCGDGKYIATGCSDSADAQCASCSPSCNPTNQYATSLCDGQDDNTCDDCDASCVDGCTGPSAADCVQCDRGAFRNDHGECEACAAQCPPDMYETAACGGTSDLQCAACTSCHADEFDNGGCSGAVDRDCQRCDEACAFGCSSSGGAGCLEFPCGDDEYYGSGDCESCTLGCGSGSYIVSPCTQTQNAVCGGCRDCGDETIETSPCDGVNNAECTSCALVTGDDACASCSSPTVDSYVCLGCSGNLELSQEGVCTSPSDDDNVSDDDAASSGGGDSSGGMGSGDGEQGSGASTGSASVDDEARVDDASSASVGDDAAQDDDRDDVSGDGSLSPSGSSVTDDDASSPSENTFVVVSGSVTVWGLSAADTSATIDELERVFVDVFCADVEGTCRFNVTGLNEEELRRRRVRALDVRLTLSFDAVVDDVASGERLVEALQDAALQQHFIARVQALFPGADVTIGELQAQVKETTEISGTTRSGAPSAIAVAAAVLLSLG